MKRYTNLEDLKKAIVEAAKELKAGPNEGRDYWLKIFVRIFDEYPNWIQLTNEGLYNQYDYNNYKSLRKIKSANIPLSCINLIKSFKDKAVIFREDQMPIIITNDFIIYRDPYTWDIDILDTVDYVRDEIMQNIVDGTDKVNTFYYVTHSSRGFECNELKAKKVNVDINKYYNDDLPHEQIMKFLKENSSGLIMLHGEPGGGKTSYLRHLISQFPKNKFLVMDSSVFSFITDSSFIGFLADYENSIVILEDCESMITENRSGNIASLLNLSDGLIGDDFKMKFICTFNTDVKNIDPALLRRGRLKVKYEFKKLDKKKVDVINKEQNLGLTTITDMTLAELFNNQEDNGARPVKRTAVGFSK